EQMHRLAGMTRAVGRHPLHLRAHVARAGAGLAHLHGQVGDVGRTRHALHAGDAAPHVVMHAGRFGIGAEGVLLHHPQVGAAVVEQRAGGVHHAAIDAGHGQRDPDQQAEAKAGEHELAPAVQDVASGEADHGATPTMRSTTSMPLAALSGLWLYTTTRSPPSRPSSTCTRPSRSAAPSRSGTKRSSRVPSTTHTPSRPSTRCTAAFGTSGRAGSAGSATVSSASSPSGGRRAGGWAKPILAITSSVTASASGSTRTTVPSMSSPARERSTICAGSSAASPVARCWSKRAWIHTLAGSTISTTAW